LIRKADLPQRAGFESGHGPDGSDVLHVFRQGGAVLALLHRQRPVAVQQRRPAFPDDLRKLLPGLQSWARLGFGAHRSTVSRTIKQMHKHDRSTTQTGSAKIRNPLQGGHWLPAISLQWQRWLFSGRRSCTWRYCVESVPATLPSSNQSMKAPLKPLPFQYDADAR